GIGRFDTGIGIMRRHFRASPTDSPRAPYDELDHIPFVPAEAGTQGQALRCLKVWVPASAGTNGDRFNRIEICSQHYSGSIPASLIIRVHLTSWTLTNSPSSSGVLEKASNPTAPRRPLTSGSSMILRSSALRRATISRGVLAGANIPAHESMSKLVMPASCKEGSSGNNVLRCSRVVAKARSVPALTC